MSANLLPSPTSSHLFFHQLPSFVTDSPGRGCRARTAKLASAWRLLLLNVVANDGDGCASTASGEVAWRPQRSTPQLLTDGWILLLANHAAGHLLHRHLLTDSDCHEPRTGVSPHGPHSPNKSVARAFASSCRISCAENMEVTTPALCTVFRRNLRPLGKSSTLRSPGGTTASEREPHEPHSTPQLVWVALDSGARYHIPLS
jgi:hypothetical protein